MVKEPGRSLEARGRFFAATVLLFTDFGWVSYIYIIPVIFSENSLALMRVIIFSMCMEKDYTASGKAIWKQWVSSPHTLLHTKHYLYVKLHFKYSQGTTKIKLGAIFGHGGYPVWASVLIRSKTRVLRTSSPPYMRPELLHCEHKIICD